MAHCPEHEEYHAMLTRVATNTDWIIRAFKVGGSVLGVIITIIILPASIWLINLDKRVAAIETRVNLHGVK